MVIGPARQIGLFGKMTAKTTMRKKVSLPQNLQINPLRVILMLQRVCAILHSANSCITAETLVSVLLRDLRPKSLRYPHSTNSCITAETLVSAQVLKGLRYLHSANSRITRCSLTAETIVSALLRDLRPKSLRYPHSANCHISRFLERGSLKEVP